MRGSNLWAPMVRNRCSEWWLRRQGGHVCASGNKRLRLGVKTVVPIVAPRDWMLALGVVGVRVDWELAICIGNPDLGLGAVPRSLPLRRLKSRLPTWLRRNWMYSCAIGSNRAVTRLIPLLCWRGILQFR